MNYAPPDEYFGHMASMFAGVAQDLQGDFSKVLDFGCGAGRLVEAMQRKGITAYGCDVDSYVDDDVAVPEDRFAKLSFDPYNLPYPDNSFDAVVSTSVLEHAQNTEEAFREIHRILKPGGLSLHLYPSKWYLPREPHIFVPFVNIFWPHVPKWWLKLWAVAGVRNEHVRGKSAAEVTEINAKYCREGLNYLPTGVYERISKEVFGNVQWPMRSYFKNSPGGMAKLWRLTPFKRPIELLSRECRMALIAHRKMVGMPANHVGALD